MHKTLLYFHTHYKYTCDDVKIGYTFPYCSFYINKYKLH